MSRIALVGGDGIGPEVIAGARRVLDSVAATYGVPLEFDEWDLSADRYLRDGVTISDDEFERLTTSYDAVLLGALGDPRVPDSAHARDILLGLRFRMDLYINFRPCILLDPALSPLRLAPETEIALEIFRENTEGLYVGIGGRLREGGQAEVAVQECVNTRLGVERIVRAAFEFARARGRTRVTLVDKANAMPLVGSLWRRVFGEVGEEFSGIRTDAMYVDAMAMDLVRRPESYEVIVTSNLFGDILSDLAAELTGGLGLAPSANVHPGRFALFEPVHGSAPDIAGQGRANPLGAIRTASLLLDHLGYAEAAAGVEAAAVASIREGVRTPDLGGTASTGEVSEWVANHLPEPTGP